MDGRLRAQNDVLYGIGDEFDEWVIFHNPGFGFSGKIRRNSLKTVVFPSGELPSDKLLKKQANKKLRRPSVKHERFFPLREFIESIQKETGNTTSITLVAVSLGCLLANGFARDLKRFPSPLRLVDCTIAYHGVIDFRRLMEEMERSSMRQDIFVAWCASIVLWLSGMKLAHGEASKQEHWTFGWKAVRSYYERMSGRKWTTMEDEFFKIDLSSTTLIPTLRAFSKNDVVNLFSTVDMDKVRRYSSEVLVTDYGGHCSAFSLVSPVREKYEKTFKAFVKKHSSRVKEQDDLSEFSF